jgi:hypothetical protein
MGASPTIATTKKADSAEGDVETKTETEAAPQVEATPAQAPALAPRLAAHPHSQHDDIWMR